MSTPSYRTYIITQEPGMVPCRKGPFYGNKMVEGFLRDAYHYNPDIICIVIDMETEDNTWYPEHGYEWLDINGDRRKRHPRKDRPKQAALPPQPSAREGEALSQTDLDSQPRYTTKRLRDEVAKAKNYARIEALEDAARQTEKVPCEPGESIAAAIRQLKAPSQTDRAEGEIDG